MEGYTLSGDSLKVIKRTVDDVASLKQQIKQVQSQYLPGLPDEIIVPRSYDSGTQTYTVDIYVFNPATSTYDQKLTGQKAKLLPDTL